MANALPDLVINIAANTATLTDGLTKASAQLSGFGKSATSSLGAIESAATLATRALGALGVAVSVAGITEFVKSTVDATASLQALSATTGSSVEELSRLANVATVTGTSFDTFQTLLSRMTVGLAGIGDGSNATARALQFLGVTAKDPAEALQQVADKLATYADDASKAALARDLFGKNGPEFIDTLKRMADAHDVLSTRTAEDARAANEFNEQLRLLSIQSTTLKDSILRDLIPGFTQMIEEFNKARAAGLGFWDSLNTATTPTKLNEHIDDLTSKIATLQQQLKNVVPGTPAALYAKGAQDDLAKYTAQLNVLLGTLQKLTPQQQAWKDALGKLSPSSGYTGGDKANSAADAAAKAAEAFTKQLTEEAATLGLTDVALKAHQASLLSLNATQKAAVTQALVQIATYNTQAQAAKDLYAAIDDGIKAYEDGLKASSDANDNATKSAQSLLDTLQAQVDTYGLSDTAAQRYNIQQQINAETAAKHWDAVDKLNKALSLLDQLEGKIAANDYAKAQADAAQQAARAVDQAARSMERSLEDALVNAFENGGKNAAQDFERWLVRTMAQLVLRPILAPITQGLASAFGGGLTGGPTSLISTAGNVGSGASALSGLGSVAGSAAGGISSLFGASDFTAALAGDAYLPGALAGGAEAAGLGSTLGGLAAAAIPVVGWIAAAGALIYSIIQSNKKPSEVEGTFGVQAGNSGFEDNASTKSPFGNLGFLDQGTKQFSGDAAQSFNQIIGGVLDLFAARETASQRTQTATALQGQNFGTLSGTFTTEDFLNKYGAGVLEQVAKTAFDVLDPPLARVVDLFKGDAQAAATFIGSLISFSDVTQKLPQDIKAGLDAALDGTQGTLDRLSAIATAYATLQDVLNADPLADATAAIEASTNSLSQAFTNQGTALQGLIDKFDGSTTAAQGLAAATQSYYAAEVQLLAGLKQASASISESFGETARGIKLSVLDQKGQGDFLADEMNSLFSSLLSATDPAQIQSLADRINQDVNQSFSLLSPDEQKQRAQEYLDYIDKANAAAQAHIDAVQQQVQAQASDEDSKLRDMLTDFVAKLNDAGATQQQAANTNLQAAQTPVHVVVDDARTPEVNGGTG